MQRRSLASWVLGVLLLGAEAFAAPSDDPADWATTLKVKLALLEELGTDSLRIDVDADGGAVTLDGTVRKRETVELASTVAKSVEGVASLRSDLELEAAKGSDAEGAVAEAEAEVKDAILETRIRLALLDELGADGFKIGTEAASGVVTLEFEPAWSSVQKQKAIAAARGVGGVNKVISVDKKS
jgi:osmotically-inducible protein OsmY